MFEVDLVLDVGANRGQFARELIRAGYEGRIVSFEPLSDAYRDLVDVSRNEPRWKVAERCAVGHRSETAILHVAGNSESSSVLPMLPSHYTAAPASRYIRSDMIMMRRLDDIAATDAESAHHPFLKLDIQGFEHRAIEGAAGILDRIAGVQVELDLTPLYEGGLLIEDMIARLRELGFSLYRLVPGFADQRSGRMLQVDGIFFRESYDAGGSSRCNKNGFESICESSDF
jgi:FkbM family methyltransferase